MAKSEINGGLRGFKSILRANNTSVVLDTYCFFYLILDYLYRVESYHGGTIGSAKSAWISSRSGQGGKRVNDLLGSTLASYF